MRLLVICPHFAPDVAPTGVVITAIVDELIRSGHEVRVVSALPWYRNHRVEPPWKGRLMRRHHETVNGVRRSVTRVYPFPTAKGSIISRAAGFTGFTGLVTAAAVGPNFRFRPDGVLAMAPPITLGPAGWVAARRWRVPLVFNVQDIFPDAAIEVGAISKPWLVSVARRLERFIYRSADAVTVLSEDMRRNVVSRIDPGWGTLVRVIPNFVDTQQIQPSSRLTPYRAEHNLGDRTVVMYAGNIGYSQPLDLMIDAARAFNNRQDVVFVVNGSGSALPALKDKASGLSNLVFVDLQPANRLNEVLASADLHVILLRKGLARSSVPSKLYSIMAAGRPVVASLDAGSEVARMLDLSNSGLSAAPNDSQAFIAAIGSLVNDPERREAMGKRGRTFVESWPSAASVASAYVDIFTELGA